MKILIGVSGSIALYKICELVRHLTKEKHTVFIAMTKTASTWVSPIIFETLTGNPVYESNFNRDMSQNSMPHIDVRNSLDLMLIAPATANIMAKAANGIADDFITTTLLTFTGERWFAPSMNPNMWVHPSVQNNIKTLKSYGYKIIEPDNGEAICGDKGIGKMASLDTILKSIADYDSYKNI